MVFGYLDESGDVGLTTVSGRFLVVALIVTPQPEKLRRAISKTRKSLGKHLQNLPEFKAADSDIRVTQKLLDHAVKIGFGAMVGVVDKTKQNYRDDLEDLYRIACARIVEEALMKFGALTVTFDRRYTKPTLRDQLEQVIGLQVENLGRTLIIRHEDSRRERILQIADAVAWAIVQRYEKEDNRFWESIRNHVDELHL